MGAEDDLERLLEHPQEEVRELGRSVLEAVDAIHREGLTRMAALLDHHDLLRLAASDSAIAELLDLYDLVPIGEEVLVERALESVRPYIQSHGGQLEVLAVGQGVVRVRLAGSCAGCSGSAMTLKRGVEAALRDGYPGFRALEVVEPEPEPVRPTFIDITRLRTISAPARPVFLDAAALSDVVGMISVEVGGVPVLLHNLDGEVYAFHRGGPRRESFPVAIEGGRVKVAVNVPAEAPAPA